MHQDDVPPGQTLRDGLKVGHYGPVPRLRLPWNLMILADLAAPTADDVLPWVRLADIDLADLLRRPTSEVVSDHHCASGWSTRGVRWHGIPATTLLDRVPPPEGTVGVLALAEFGYSANLRLEDLLRPTTLIATGLDGAELPPEHGGPVRLVVPHLFGYKSVKWFRGWQYLRRPRRGFWEERGYHLVGDPWLGQRYSYQE